jgi:hypothetical protein
VTTFARHRLQAPPTPGQLHLDEEPLGLGVEEGGVGGPELLQTLRQALAMRTAFTGGIQ